MQQGAIGIDQTDSRILNALQIWPRAPWATLGALLNVDPITVARRWQRLNELGAAWLVAHPHTRYASTSGVLHSSLPGHHAMVDLQVRPDRLGQLLGELSELQEVMMLRTLIGAWNVSLHWKSKDLAELEHALNWRLPQVRGIHAVRSAIITDVVVDGSRWRLDDLSHHQQQQLRQAMRADLQTMSASAEGSHPIDDKIIELVCEDPRMSLTELAQRTETSVNTTRRHLGHLLRSRDLIVRCDIARQITDRPVTVAFYASVHPEQIEHIARYVGAVPEVRTCAVLVGESNLLITVWLNSVYDSTEVEAALTRNVPTLTIRSRDVVARFYKLASQELDERGFRVKDRPAGSAAPGAERPLRLGAR